MVVKTAGPTSKGTPKGTTPSIKEVVNPFLFSGKIKSYTPKIKRITPPAIKKSSFLIPKILKKLFPKSKKPTARRNPAIIDSHTIFFLLLSSKSAVKETKIGNNPTGSMAINKGIKVDKKIIKNYLSGITESAGNSFPSRNSNEAPPPVETQESLFFTPNSAAAEAVSPPPAITSASSSAK